MLCCWGTRQSTSVIKQQNLNKLYDTLCYDLKEQRKNFKTSVMKDTIYFKEWIQDFPQYDYKSYSHNSDLENGYEQFLSSNKIEYRKYLWEQIAVYTVIKNKREVIISIIPIVVMISGIWFRQI